MSEIVHNSLIAIHAVGAGICFLSGLLVLRPPVDRFVGRRLFFNIFLGMFPFLLFPLYLAIGLEWVELSFSEMIIFPALGLLDLFMAWRAFEAYRVLKSQPEGWRLKYIGHVGFNLISLFAGFVIVLAIDLGFPVWLVGIIAALSIVGGIYAVGRVRSKEKTTQIK